MSIKFSCPTCGDQVRTPDAMAGRRGKCPHCHAVITIPQPASPTLPTIRIGADGKLEFSCPGCGQLVRVPVAAAGRRGECPHCHIVVQIPEATAAAPRRQPSLSLVQTPDGDLEFRCPHCHELVRTLAAAAGKKGMCPHCDATFTIPQPDETSLTALADESTVKLTLPNVNALSEQQAQQKSAPESGATKPAPPAPTPQIDFSCPECGRKMRVPAHLTGKKGRCPGCQTTMIIPAAGEKTVVRAPSTKPEPKRPLQTTSVANGDLTPIIDGDLQPIDGLTPIGGLVPIGGVKPVDGLTPIDGLTSIGDLTPISDLTPVDGLTPIGELKPRPVSPATDRPKVVDGLTPLVAAPVGLTPLSAPSAPLTAVLVADVDDGKALIPLRETAITATLKVSNPYDWSESTGAANPGPTPLPTGLTPSVPATLGGGSNFALLLTMIGLWVGGMLQAAAGLIWIFVVLNSPAATVLVSFWTLILLLGILQFAAGFLVLQRIAYRWCIAAAVVALFNPCFGTPTGILGLIMLLQAPVKATFKR